MEGLNIPADREEYTPTLLFGDEHEFSYESCVEHVSPATGEVNEVTLFFRDTDNAVRAFEVIQHKGLVRPAYDADQRIVYSETLDPELILQLLSFDSATIRRLSQIVPTEEVDP